MAQARICDVCGVAEKLGDSHRGGGGWPVRLPDGWFGVGVTTKDPGPAADGRQWTERDVCSSACAVAAVADMTSELAKPLEAVIENDPPF